MTTIRPLALALAGTVACANAAPRATPHSKPIASAPSASVVSIPSASEAPAAPRPFESDLALVVILDRTGSMSGPRFESAIRAANTALATIHENELFELIAVGEAAEVVVSMRRPIDRQAITKRITSIASPMGHANLSDAMAIAESDLAGFVVRARHLLLVTDGEGPEDGIYNAIKKARASGSTVTVMTLAPPAKSSVEVEAHSAGARVVRVDLKASEEPVMDDIERARPK